MAKLEPRPGDQGVVNAKGKTDAELAGWWKERVALLAAVPTDVARAGAIVPMMRELAELPDAERRRQTRARIQAVVASASDQRQRVMAGARLAGAIDPELVKADQDLAQQIAAEIPGAADLWQQTGTR